MMPGKGLAKDYIKRAEIRLRAVGMLLDEKSWPDVVLESQEVVELALKAFLRSNGIAPPQAHDVSRVLLAERALLPKSPDVDVDRSAEISKNLRRDRELAFYGSEDLTPLDFYSRADGERALNDATYVVQAVKPWVK